MLKRLTSEIGSRPLGLARIIIGIAALMRAFDAGRTLIELTRPEILHAPYLDWLPDPTVPLVIVIITVWVVSGLLFVLGWRVAITGSLLLISIVTTLALDQQTYSNHLYLMSWLVLLITLADGGAGINIHRKDRPVVMWPVLLMQLQLSIVYGFSALTKINESFLSGEVLASALGRGLVPFPDAWRTPRLLVPVATLTLFVELFIAIFIWRDRFRPAAFVLGFGLHLAITLQMADTLQLLVFSLEMLSIYPLFLTREPLQLAWDDGCATCRAWIGRFKKLDVLRTIEPVASDRTATPALRLTHLSETTTGFGAMIRTLEHLVPTLWVAPVLRLPGIRHAGERWFQWQARRGSCPAAESTVSGPTEGSRAH